MARRVHGLPSSRAARSRTTWGCISYSAQDIPAEQEIHNARDYIWSRHEAHGLRVVMNELASTSRRPADVDRFHKEVAGWLDDQYWAFEYGFFGVSRWPVGDFCRPCRVVT